MNRRELFGVGLCAVIPTPALAKLASLPSPVPMCQHRFYLWPRTANGEDHIRQCVHCGEQQRKKMEWCFPYLRSTDFYFGERSVGDWQPDGKSDPTWVRKMAMLP
jgi:hypothetical protein